MIFHFRLRQEGQSGHRYQYSHEPGAVVIVSHDPNMVERVADRLWLVKDGSCSNFEGDLEDYRKFTIQSRRDERKEEKEKKSSSKTPDKPKPANDSKKKIEKSEKEIARLNKEIETLEAAMAAPGFYENGKNAAEIQSLYAKTLKELEIEEETWLEAQVCCGNLA